MVTGNNKHYFMPGELIIMVVHDDTQSASDAIKEFLAELDTAAQNQQQQQHQKKGVNSPLLSACGMAYEPRSYARPSGDNSMVSITKVVLESDDEDLQIEYVIDWMTVFAEQFQLINEQSTGQQIMNVITPNWLSIPTPVPTADGGPGGQPEPTNPGWIPFTGGIIEQIEAESESCPVDVFVLDTIPDDDRWQKPESYLQNHPVWQRVHTQSFSKRQPYKSSALQPWLDDLQGPRHDYEMPDHGLFIAGTIAMLAPNADIHLVQVLNKYGVGTLESVLEGLDYVIQNRNREHKTVVNCSFMLSIPLTKPQLYKPLRGAVEAFLTQVTIHDDDYIWDEALSTRGKGKGKGPYKKLTPRPQLERWLVYPLIEVLNVLYERIAMLDTREAYDELADDCCLMIFAAAGNDGRDKKHPPAMYPAAYRPVWGVGALDADESNPNKMANYSNIADSPVTDGFLTFGGLPGNKGMLGLYIHPFPNGTTGTPIANNNGWARWSGTSFATGVMSGLAAALLCNRTPSQVLTILRNLVVEGSDEPHRVDIEQV